MGRLKRPKPLHILMLIIAVWIIITIVIWQRNTKVSNKNLEQLVPVKKEPGHNDWRNSNIKKDNKRKQVAFSIPGCHCQRFADRRRKNSAGLIESTCSSYSTTRGPRQKVFSYSYYRPGKIKTAEKIKIHTKMYLEQMKEKLILIGDNFPGWLVRLYHNISSGDLFESKYLCDMYCKFDFFDPCDVTDLPIFGDLNKEVKIGRLWRLVVMGDPTVSIFLSRDTDTSILQREIAAVNEWLESKKTFHVMRDHPQQMIKIHAGLWGGRNRAELAEWRDELFYSRRYPTSLYRKNYDQWLLRDLIWPKIEKDVLQHVSYHCAKYPGSIPFPTRRYQYYYVGWGPSKKNDMTIVAQTSCVPKCRKHISWTHC